MTNQFVLDIVAKEEMRIKIDILLRIVTKLPGAEAIDMSSIEAEVINNLGAPIAENFERGAQEKAVQKIVASLR